MALYQRGKKWSVDLYVRGERVRKVVSANKKLAEQVHHKLQTQAVEGRYLDKKKTEKVKFGDLTKQYLEYAKVNKKSWGSDALSIKHLTKFFGNQFLSAITSLRIEKYKAQRKEDGVRPATVNREVQCLKHMFNKGIEWELTDDNPVRKVRFFREDNRRLRFLSHQEVEELYQAGSERLRPILLTALYTGMRRGEILGLRWEDLDFTHKVIFVKETKNGESREIPMNKHLEEALRELKHESEHVFPGGSVRTAFEGALRRAGIRDFRFHDLRHTFASHLVMSGVDLLVVKELLGHKSLEMTLRYAHLSPHHKSRAVDSLKFLDSHNLVTSPLDIKFKEPEMAENRALRP